MGKRDTDGVIFATGESGLDDCKLDVELVVRELIYFTPGRFGGKPKRYADRSLPAAS